jgi:hypothetical protein
MKATSNPSRIQKLTNSFFEMLLPEDESAPRPTQEADLPGEKSRRPERQDFSCYMQLFDHNTQELVGHLTDISSGGFKLDSLSPIPPNKDFRFYLDLTPEVAQKPNMMFVARSRWCKVDPLDPFCYNVGFQLINIAPEDLEIFNRMIERYGTKKAEISSFDLRRSNKW